MKMWTLVVSILLTAALPAGCGGGRYSSVADKDEARAEILRVFSEEAAEVRLFEFRQFVVACLTDSATAGRVELFTRTFLPDLARYFEDDGKPIRAYVFETHDQVLKHMRSICDGYYNEEEDMGFYHAPTRSVLCSLEWGLGWLGDIYVQALMSCEEAVTGTKSNRWFKQAFVSMIYNCFRTPDGAFCGLNVMSYYHPQAQYMINNDLMMPLATLMRNEYDPEKQQKRNGPRVQGRNFLAYLFAQDRLFDFYENYKRTRREDPSGIVAAEHVLGAAIDEIDRNFRTWLMQADGEISDSEMAKPYPVLGVLVKRSVQGNAVPGIVLHEVSSNSPAARAGLQRGDRIVSINGTSINNIGDLIGFLQRQDYGSTVEVRLGLQERLVSVVLDRFIDG